MVTTRPEQADFFFVPIYGECFLWSWEMLRRENRAKSFEYTNALYLEVLGRGLHSSTFGLNVNALCWIGAAFRGCLWDV